MLTPIPAYLIPRIGFKATVQLGSMIAAVAFILSIFVTNITDDTDNGGVCQLGV